MNSKIEKVLKYVKGAGIKYGIYGLKYRFDNTLDYSRVKYGKKKFIYSKIKNTVKKYKNYSKYKELTINSTNKKHLDKFPIWVCWFQGIEQAPEIVKMCVKSIQDNIPQNAQIHIITMDNLKQYIKLPDIIEKHIKKGDMTLTQYSDIVRYTLLSTYGGFWIDSTILVTSNISDLCNYDYYTRKSDRLELNFGNYMIQGRFTVHLGKGDYDNILYNFICDAYKEYYKKTNIAVDYFLTSFFVDIAYENIPECRKMMDKLEYNDRGLEARLCENLNNVYNEEEYKLYCENMPFQKLSYKLDKYIEEIDGKLTFYGHIIRNYRNNK